MTTSTKETDIRQILNSGNLNLLATALQRIKAGNMLSKVKAVFASLTGATSHDITSAASTAAATVTGMALDTDELLPAAGAIVAVNVTGGAAAAGPRIVGDAAATPSATVCTISDDGTTLTFEANVTDFTLIYYPAPALALDTALPHGAP